MNEYMKRKLSIFSRSNVISMSLGLERVNPVLVKESKSDFPWIELGKVNLAS